MTAGEVEAGNVPTHCVAFCRNMGLWIAFLFGGENGRHNIPSSLGILNYCIDLNSCLIRGIQQLLFKYRLTKLVALVLCSRPFAIISNVSEVRSITLRVA